MPHSSLADELRARDEAKRRAASNGRPHPAAGAYPEDERGDADETDYSYPELSEPPAPKEEKKPRQSAFRWDPISSATLATTDYRQTWLAKNAIVANQPCMGGGVQKTLKTSIAGVDLGISLAFGMPWLGYFDCPAQKRVAILSGESGPWALQSIARRVCHAKGVNLADAGENLRWLFHLPQLGVMDQLDALGEGLARDSIEVVIVDPLYLCLLAGAKGPEASNLYDTGPLLMNVSRTCLTAGATPILLHHANKPAARKFEPLDLADLAFSGVAEFARQWILLSRREAYQPGSGLHRLHMVTGGSVGHGGLWAVDVDEGQLADDFTGRTWDVTVSTAGDARQCQASSQEQAKRQRQEAAIEVDARSVLHVLDINDTAREGLTFTRLRDSSGMSGPRFGAAITRLKDHGLIKEVSGTAPVGNRAIRPARIIKRTQNEGDFVEERNNRQQPSDAS